MKKYTYVPGSFIAAWLIWELIVCLGGFNEALLPTPYKVLLGFGELIGDGVLFKDIADSLVRFFIGYIISVVAGERETPLSGGSVKFTPKTVTGW